MPRLISSPTSIPVPGGKVINEHVGRVNTGTEAVSVAHMVAPPGWDEPAQAPAFDEITLVLKGEVIVDHDGGRRPVDHHLSGGAGPLLLWPGGRRVRRRVPPGVLARDREPGGRRVIFRRSESTDAPAASTVEVPPGELRLAEKIRRAPKALLHDHLDGGLRPQTVIEIADQVGYAALPATDAQSLGAWFRESADSGSLVRYLETFDHTLAVMQTADGLRRVAREAVLDLAEEGVVYAESRYAPEQHLEAGLQLEDVVEAVNAGFREGEGLAAEAGHPIRVTALLTAMRHAAKSTEIAELAVRYRDEGVAGFDIAGAEAGFPPTRHLDAFEYLRRENAHFTIHAGEAFGLPSIWEAIQWCGADRLGHGVRI